MTTKTVPEVIDPLEYLRRIIKIFGAKRDEAESPVSKAQWMKATDIAMATMQQMIDEAREAIAKKAAINAIVPPILDKNAVLNLNVQKKVHPPATQIIGKDLSGKPLVERND